MFETDRSREFFIASLVPIAALIAYFFSGSAAVVTTATLAMSAIAMSILWKMTVTSDAAVSRLIRDHQRTLNEYQTHWQTLQSEAVQGTTALSRMRDGVVMLSQCGSILLINQAAIRLLNLDISQDYVAMKFEEVVRIPELSQKLLATGAEAESQKLLLEVGSGDTTRPIEFRIDQVAQGVETRLLMTLSDESEARRVDAMRREFVANISHELKTPLAAIKGYAETVELAINDDPGAAVQFMSRIHVQCLRLERLISDMMQLARAQAGRENLNICTVMMADVIAESLKSYRPIADSRNVHLIVEEHLAGAVYSDPEATLTIANNLIGNAIYYTPSGGKVTVSCRRDGAELCACRCRHRSRHCGRRSKANFRAILSRQQKP